MKYYVQTKITGTVWWAHGYLVFAGNGPDLLLERRFFIVEKRDRETLLQIMKNEIKTGTTIYSDQRTEYSSVNHRGYIYQTVTIQNFLLTRKGDPIEHYFQKDLVKNWLSKYLASPTLKG